MSAATLLGSDSPSDNRTNPDNGGTASVPQQPSPASNANVAREFPVSASEPGPDAGSSSRSCAQDPAGQSGETIHPHAQQADGHSGRRIDALLGAGEDLLPEEVAHVYLARGWAPVPVPRGEKAAKLPGWPTFSCDAADVDTTFTGMNVGVVLGERSGGLVDIDLDCREAEQLAPHILPATDAIFGHKSKPRSHRLYKVDSALKTKKYADATGGVLAELRAKGVMTIFPGSVHPSGEPIVWSKAGGSPLVTPQALQKAVAQLAAASLLARSWPREGRRQDAAIALAGGLYRSGMPRAEIPDLVEAIAAAAGDEEAESRRRGSEATIAKADAGEEVTGWPTLAELMANEVVDRCRRWLGHNGKVGTEDGRNGEDVTGGSTGKKSFSQVMVESASEHVAEFFRDDDRSFATFTVGNNGWRHEEHHPLRGKRFKQWLRVQFHRQLGTPPGSQAVQDAVEMLDASTQHAGGLAPTFLRMAPHEDGIFVDLCHDQWLAVHIMPGGWKVVDRSPVKFVRRRGMTALPLPVPWGTIDELRPFLNVEDDDAWMLIIGWLLMALSPSGPYPILAVNGEQGSTKSTACRMLRALIDPSLVPFRSEPREPRDLVIAAENARVLSFDNLSSLPPWLSDGLCRIATGGGFGTRELYTDSDERLFYATRPILLNGIGEFGTRSDLIDRCLCITLPQMDSQGRRAESELWKDFERAQPRILGALFDAVAVALANRSTVQLSTLPRMADFAKWVVAAEQCLGWAPGRFMDAYCNNAEVASQAALDASLIAAPLIDLIKRTGRWKGAAKQLLAELNQSTAVTERVKHSKYWPDGPAYLGSMLRRIAPNLRKAGFEVNSGRTGRARWLEFVAPNAPPPPARLGQVATEQDRSDSGDGW